MDIKSHYYSWKINNIGKMTMYNFHTHSNNPYDSEDYKRAAGHEFGHFLGLKDAYKENEVGGKPTKETFEATKDDIMWEGDIVSFNDMEMFFLAALYNEKQYFNSSKKSEAITE